MRSLRPFDCSIRARRSARSRSQSLSRRISPVLSPQLSISSTQALSKAPIRRLRGSCALAFRSISRSNFRSSSTGRSRGRKALCFIAPMRSVRRQIWRPCSFRYEGIPCRSLSPQLIVTGPRPVSRRRSTYSAHSLAVSAATSASSHLSAAQRRKSVSWLVLAHVRRWCAFGSRLRCRWAMKGRTSSTAIREEGQCGTPGKAGAPALVCDTSSTRTQPVWRCP